MKLVIRLAVLLLAFLAPAAPLVADELEVYVVSAWVEHPWGLTKIEEPHTVIFSAALQRAQTIKDNGICQVTWPAPAAGVKGAVSCLPASQVRLVEVVSVPYNGAPGRELVDTSVCSARINSLSLRKIKDPRGGHDGRVWVELLVDECQGEADVAWSVSAPGYIEDWHRDKGQRVAWVAGPQGTYTVTAVSGGMSASIQIVIPGS